MSILSDLKNQAVSEMGWDPADDYNYTFVPYRYGRITGDRYVVRTHRNLYELPPTGRYTLYTINQLSPEEVGLDLDRHALRNWISLEELGGHCNTVIHAYINQLMLPLDSIYVKIDNAKEFLIAVEANINSVLLRSGYEFRLRFFSNDWLGKNTVSNPNAVRTKSVHITEIEQAAPVLNLWRNAPAHTRMLFHNGYLLDNLTTASIVPSDIISTHLDSTIVGKVEHTISRLNQFHSTMDNETKLIVPLNLSSRTRQVPFDEVDIYIIGYSTYRGIQRTVGFLYDRIADKDLRQLTHQDLAISSDRVFDLYNRHKDFLQMHNPRLRIYIRQTRTASMTLPRLPGNYADQLYRCNMTQRKSLMLGPNNHFDRWKPANLERSGFSNWAHSNLNEQYAQEGIQGVYSYEELCRKVSEGLDPAGVLVTEPLTGEAWTYYPLLATVGGMSLSFDADGVLLESIRVAENSYGRSRRCMDGTASVSFIPGNLNPNALEWDRDTNFYDQSDVFGEVFYWRDGETSAWELATEGTSYTIDVTTGAITWAAFHDDHERMRRSIRDSSYRKLEIEPELLYHKIDIFEVPPVSHLKLSHLDVHLNGRYLVEGIDYSYVYPQIQLHSKEYYKNESPTTVTVEIYHYGLPDQPSQFRDYGWVRNRRMVEGSQYMGLNLGQDCYVDGKRAQVGMFDLMESPNAGSVYREGGLWQRRSVLPAISPWLEKVFDTDQTSLRTLSYAVSRHLAKPYDMNRQVFVSNFHRLFSPAAYTIVQAIRSGDIVVRPGGVSRGAVGAALYDYQDIIDADMAQLDIDWDMVVIDPLPHNEVISMAEHEIAWLRVANDMFFHGRIYFNSFITT